MFNSFCAYRFPDENKIQLFKGNLTEGICEGFVIAPFDLSEHNPVSIVSLHECDWSELSGIIQFCDDSASLFEFPHESTTRKQHKKEIESIIEELDGNPEKKTIAAKVILRNQSIDLPETFVRLCKEFPSSFIFAFHTPVTGGWIGASPELLLDCDQGILHTYALAGTRPADSEGDWDKKNINEQRIVERYISRCFEKWGLKPECSPTATCKAGKVEHLLTRICADTSERITDLLLFLKDLSPTPALCGLPKEESKERINRLENFNRGYYGGFCGPFKSPSRFSFYVNLRSVRFDKTRWCMFAGGGITPASDPDAEWIETERKAAGIIKNLQFAAYGTA